MLNSKVKITITVLAQCLVLSACAPSSKSPSPDPASIKVSTDLVCQNQNYDLISKSNNLNQLNQEVDYHVNTLSGAAVALKGLTESSKIIEKSNGLAQVCQQDYLALEITCKGDLKVIGADKTETLTQDQLVAQSPLYVKTAVLCGSLKLKQSEALYIVADHITFQGLSVELEKSAILSLSAREVSMGTRDNLKINQDAGSAVMIHAYTLK